MITIKRIMTIKYIEKVKNVGGNMQKIQKIETQPQKQSL